VREQLDQQLNMRLNVIVFGIKNQNLQFVHQTAIVMVKENVVLHTNVRELQDHLSIMDMLNVISIVIIKPKLLDQDVQLIVIVMDIENVILRREYVKDKLDLHFINQNAIMLTLNMMKVKMHMENLNVILIVNVMERENAQNLINVKE
jgi:hypothetical protein